MRMLCMGIGFRKDLKLVRALNVSSKASPTPTESLADYFVRSEVLHLTTFAGQSHAPRRGKASSVSIIRTIKKLSYNSVPGRLLWRQAFGAKQGIGTSNSPTTHFRN